MGQIVAAVGTCHTPYLFTRPPDEDPKQLDAAAAAIILQDYLDHRPRP